MERDCRIDTLKGVLISFVVLGHCILWGGDSSVVANWIYLFHMPFFVFISGYYSHVNSHSYLNGILAIAESYVVFQLLKGFLYGYTPSLFITTPASMMWYLLVLIVWRCLYYLWANTIKVKPTIQKNVNITVWIILFIIGLAVGTISGVGKTFALSRMAVFAPFFWLGTMTQGKDFISICKNTVSPWGAIIILCLTFSLIVYLTPQSWLNVREIVRGVKCYPPDSQLIGLFSRASFYALALIICICLTSFIVEIKILSHIGKDSLKFYLFHGVILKLMSLFHMPWNWWLSIIYFIVLMISIYYFNKTKLSTFAIRPIHFIKKNISNKN